MKLVINFLRVISIKKAQDASTNKVDELIGFLPALEIAANDKHEKKNKNVTFKADVEDDEEQVEEDSDDNLT